MLKKLAPGQVFYVENPTWTGSAFADADAQSFWRQLPNSLHQVAVAEFAAGNTPSLIQLDVSTGVVLLVFSAGPCVPIPADPDLAVHTKHAFGNYCYDGTKCTVESKEIRAFIAFEDPEWVDDAL
jgi:hypothetical protein